MTKILEQLIAEGEHQQQDFKFCINDSRKIAKSLVAFANSDGGRLLIGVKDNGVVAGVKSDEEYYMVEAAARIFSKPAIDFSLHQWNNNGKTVLQIDVPSSGQRPHYAKDESDKWLAYIRKDDENLLASFIQLKVWERQKCNTGVFINYTATEKLLLDYLEEHQSITPQKLSKIAHIPFRKAQQLIIDFVLLDIITIEPTPKNVLYKLNENFNRLEWDIPEK